MSYDLEKTYQLVWDQENQFAYAVAKQVLDKPKISVWLVLIPILFLYYAHKIQQYKAGIHGFSKGLMRSKILALDSATGEVNTGNKDESYKEAFVSKDLETSSNVMRVLNTQIAEVKLLKTHYEKLLREQGSSYHDLVKKAYKTSGNFRFFLNNLAKAEEDVQDAVLRAYHPSEQAQSVVKRMQKVVHALREEEVKKIFG